MDRETRHLIAYVKGLRQMLRSVQNGRTVHTRKNLESILALWAELMERIGPNETIRLNLPVIAEQVKNIYRESEGLERPVPPIVNFSYNYPETE